MGRSRLSFPGKHWFTRCIVTQPCGVVLGAAGGTTLGGGLGQTGGSHRTPGYGEAGADGIILHFTGERGQNEEGRGEEVERCTRGGD